MKRKVTHIDDKSREALLIDYSLFTDWLSGADNENARSHGYKYGYLLSDINSARLKGEFNLVPYEVPKATKRFDEFVDEFEPKIEKMKTRQEIYEGLLKKWVELNDLKVGSMVTVVRDAYEDAEVSHAGFVVGMGETIGKTFAIEAISNCSILLSNGWQYAYSCLEKSQIPVKKEVSFDITLCQRTFNFPTTSIKVTDKGATIDGIHLTVESLSRVCVLFKEMHTHGVELFSLGDFLLSIEDVGRIEYAIKELKK